MNKYIKMIAQVGSAGGFGNYFDQYSLQVINVILSLVVNVPV